VVFILWGSFAGKKEALIDWTRHLVLKSAHPSPLSATKGFFGNNHFKIANEYLVKHGRGEIDWR
ncbi:MAG: uracil-DNA glycosylase, partial [Patescibacteria group bacterium]